MRWVLTAFLLLAFLLLETLLGGTRMVFSLPACGVLALAGLLSLAGPWRGMPHLRSAPLIAAGLFVGWILLRAAWSPVGYLARADVSLALAALVVYLLTTLLVVTSRQRLAVVLGLLVIALVQAMIGGFQQFGGERFALFGLLEPEDYGRRASGLYICPNHLAGFLEVTALLGLGVACWSRRGMVVRGFALAGAAASLFGLALTGSRGGYVSAACGLVVFALGSLWVLWCARNRRAWAGLAVAAVISLTFLAGVGAVYSRHGGLQVRVARLQETDDGRLRLWHAAWAQARLHPATGTGSGTYHYYARLFRPSTVQADPVHAHNDYLELVAEYGLVGLLAGLGLLAMHLGSGFRTLRAGKVDYAASFHLPRSDTLALNLGALGAVVALAVHSVVDFNLHVPANAMVLAFVFGLLAQPLPPAPAAESPPLKPLSVAARLVLPAAAVGLAILTGTTLPAEYEAERARLALRDELYDETVRRARTGLALDAGNPFLWRYLGQAHAAQGETHDSPAAARTSFLAAVDAFEGALRLYPQEQWSLVGLGSALDALERYEQAEVIFRRAIAWNPTSSSMHFHLATHLRLAGRHDEAEAAYRRSLELWHNAGALHGLELLAQAREGRDTP